MWLFEALIGLAAKKMAPAQEDERPYIFTGKDTANIANNQTFAPENTDEVFAAIGDEWDEDILRLQREQEARSRGEYVKPDDDELPNDGPRWHPPTPTAMVADETPPITEGERLYTAAPIVTATVPPETPPPITTTTPANVNITEPPIYYNFPITVVAGFMGDPHAALRRMIAWPTYEALKIYTSLDRGEQRLIYAMDELKYIVEDETKQDWYHFCGETYRQYKGPRCGVSRKMWLEATESVDYWREDEKVLFLGSLAAKSIQGNKPYALTCNSQMCARMNGRATTYASDEEMREQSDPLILRYFSRKRWQRMRRDLDHQYRVATYSQRNMRGYYISTKMPLDRLAKAVVRKRAKTAKSYAERMREAGDNARKYIAEQQE